MRTIAIFVLLLASPFPMHATIPRAGTAPPRAAVLAAPTEVSVPLAEGRENLVEIYHPDGETKAYVIPPKQTSLVFRAAPVYETTVPLHVYLSVEAKEYPKRWYMLQVTENGEMSLKEIAFTPTATEVCTDE